MTTFSLPQSTARRRMPSAHAPKKNGIPSNGSAPDLGSAPVLLDIDRIEPHPDNPRDDFADDDEELLALVESLKATKLINPIQVEQISLNAERYRILCGERRWRAAKLAGWTTIPAVICRLSRADALAMLIDENVQRKNLNPLELAKFLQAVHRPAEEGGCGLSYEEIGNRFGHGKSWANNLANITRLPAELKAGVVRGEITVHCARLLAVEADRESVMAAVIADRQRNPDQWATGLKTQTRLSEIIKQIDELEAQPTVAEPDVAAQTEAGPSPAIPELQRVPVRRSAPLNHAMPPARPEQPAGQVAMTVVPNLLTNRNWLSRLG